MATSWPASLSRSPPRWPLATNDGQENALLRLLCRERSVEGQRTAYPRSEVFLGVGATWPDQNEPGTRAALPHLEGPRAGLCQRRVVCLRANPDEQVLAHDPASHVPADHERQAAEHLLLGRRRHGG